MPISLLFSPEAALRRWVFSFQSLAGALPRSCPISSKCCGHFPEDNTFFSSLSQSLSAYTEGKSIPPTPILFIRSGGKAIRPLWLTPNAGCEVCRDSPHSTNRFPCSKRASLQEKLGAVCTQLPPDYSALFSTASSATNTDTKQASFQDADSYLLLKMTQDVLVCFSAVTEGERAGPRASSCTGDFLYYNKTKFQISEKQQITQKRFLVVVVIVVFNLDS